MSAGAVLAVFAHPDDESLLAGGTLAACAALGARVVLVSATRGELGPGGAGEAPSAEARGAMRERELRRAGRALGAAAVECLGFPDGGLAWADRRALEARLVATVGRWSPELVVTFGPEGLYWHPDHVAVHEGVCAALDVLAGDGLSPRLEYATWPEGWMVDLVAAARSRGLPADFFGLAPDAFGAPAASIATTRDVRAFLTAKLRALRSHRSQLGACGLLRGLPRDIAERFLGREFFVAARKGRSDCRFLERAAPPVAA